MNIYEKMMKITNELGVIEKGLKVEVSKTRSYKAVSERDILDAIKPLEEKYKVYSYPVSRKVIDSGNLVSETEYGTKNTTYLRIETEYAFINIDDPNECIRITTYGDGMDTGDKAPGKAMTYADKYALMKAYKISTGDDPDKEASPENGYKKTESRKINLKELGILQQTIAKYNLTDERVNEILKKYGYTKLDEVDFENYAKIGNEMSK